MKTPSLPLPRNKPRTEVAFLVCENSLTARNLPVMFQIVGCREKRDYPAVVMLSAQEVHATIDTTGPIAELHC